MKKKGFTLVEIIVVIAIIAFIGTVSFFGIRLVNNNIKENKLESIEKQILSAAEVYIETNTEVKKQVNDEGVIIPLNVLHNEGLINLDGIIDKNDDDYVVALLGDSVPGEECESTYIEGSWEIGSKTIYICTKNTGSGGSNLAIIDPNSMSNSNKASREPFYFTGSNPYNYVNHNGKTYRILYVDTDDSLVLVGDDLEGAFNSNQMQKTEVGLGTSGSFGCDINTGKVKYSGSSIGKLVNGVTFISAKDLIMAKECYVSAFNINSNEIENCTHSGISLNTGWSCSVVGSATSGGSSVTYLSWLNLKVNASSVRDDKENYGSFYYKNGSYSYNYNTAYAVTFDNKKLTYQFLNPESIKLSYNKCGFNVDRKGITNPISCDDSSFYKTVLYQKVHLKSCMKLNGGTGSYENPYGLKPSC